MIEVGQGRRRPGVLALAGVVALGFFLAGGYFLLYRNALNGIGHFKERIQVQVVLDPGISDEVVPSLVEDLQGLAFVETVQWHPPEDLFQYLQDRGVDPKQRASLEQWWKTLGNPPLPHILVLTPSLGYRNGKGLEDLAQHLTQLPQVQEVHYDRQTIRRLDRLEGLLGALLPWASGGILGGLALLTAMVFRITGPGALELLQRGRWIFVFRGAWAGLLGGCGGMLLLGLGYGILTWKGSPVLPNVEGFPLVFFSPEEIGGGIGLGLILGGIGGWISTWGRRGGWRG